jgi:hypothetical protein
MIKILLIFCLSINLYAQEGGNLENDVYAEPVNVEENIQDYGSDTLEPESPVIEDTITPVDQAEAYPSALDERRYEEDRDRDRDRDNQEAYKEEFYPEDNYKEEPYKDDYQDNYKEPEPYKDESVYEEPEVRNDAQETLDNYENYN